MTPEQFRRVREVLERAFERAPEQRAAWIDEACGDDPQVHGEARRLLDELRRGARRRK